MKHSTALINKAYLYEESLEIKDATEEEGLREAKMHVDGYSGSCMYVSIKIFPYMYT